MIELLVKTVVAYFLGGVMGGDIMRRMKGGGDLRNEGSGNVGATNALRARGASFAIGVLLIDIGKGVVAALALPLIPWHFAGASTWPVAWIGLLCGFAAAVGHCFPVLLRFRGGKGVATATGVFGALLPAALPWMIVLFAMLVMLTGWVAVASIGGALAAFAYVLIAGPGLNSATGLFAAAMLALIVFKHRSNIANLIAGREHRFEKARVLGRKLDQWRGR